MSRGNLPGGLWSPRSIIIWLALWGFLALSSKQVHGAILLPPFWCRKIASGLVMALARERARIWLVVLMSLSFFLLISGFLLDIYIFYLFFSLNTAILLSCSLVFAAVVLFFSVLVVFV